MGGDFPGDKFIGEWTGLVEIKEGGAYTFASTSDDGCAPISFLFYTTYHFSKYLMIARTIWLA